MTQEEYAANVVGILGIHIDPMDCSMDLIDIAKEILSPAFAKIAALEAERDLALANADDVYKRLMGMVAVLKAENDALRQRLAKVEGPIKPGTEAWNARAERRCIEISAADEAAFGKDET